jgi:hypothetical protein
MNHWEGLDSMDSYLGEKVKVDTCFPRSYCSPSSGCVLVGRREFGKAGKD